MAFIPIASAEAMKLFPFTILGLLCPLLFAKGPVFLEKGGIVAIEAESNSSRRGSWKEKTDVKDFQGSCHLEFTGNSTISGPPKSPLKYYFKVKKAGNYQLTLRARKRLETKREDISNDCYIALKGDFEAGGGAPLKTLKEDTKMFGGKAEEWGWANTLDFHQKAPAIYSLQPGEVYQLTISGRSKNFNIDRLLLVHESVGLRKAQSSNPKESKREEDIDDGPVTRTLTNTEGKEVDAQLILLQGDILHAKIKGRSYKIPLNTLSREDQEFIKKWANDALE